MRRAGMNRRIEKTKQRVEKKGENQFLESPIPKLIATAPEKQTHPAALVQ
jgi:hypothetical protein